MVKTATRARSTTSELITERSCSASDHGMESGDGKDAHKKDSTLCLLPLKYLKAKVFKIGEKGIKDSNKSMVLHKLSACEK